MTDRITPLRTAFEQADDAVADHGDHRDRRGRALGEVLSAQAKALRDGIVEVYEERVEFNLSYTYDPSRRFTSYGLKGKDLPNAFDPNDSTAPGSWDDPEFWERIGSEDDAIREALKVAVAEAVHEVLEWFRVDGEPHLDPHDSIVSEEVIMACYELGERLHATAHRVRKEHDASLRELQEATPLPA